MRRRVSGGIFPLGLSRRESLAKGLRQRRVLRRGGRISAASGTVDVGVVARMSSDALLRWVMLTGLAFGVAVWMVVS
jgi:hypothetical protein